MRRAPIMFAALLLTAGCSWPQWGSNAEHRGTSFAPGLTSTTIANWTTRSVAAAAGTTPIVGAHGLLFVVADGRLQAVHPNTGAVVWAADLPTGGTGGGSPAVFSSGDLATVFVSVATSTRPVLVGFDVDGVRNCNPLTQTCTPIFSAALGTAPGPTTPLLVAGTKVFAHAAGALEAFDAAGTTSCTTSLGTATCNPLWTAPNIAVTELGPTATQATVYDVGAGSMVQAFDIETGALRWRGALPNPPSAIPSVTNEGVVLVPSGAVVAGFTGNGCGAPTCAPAYTLTDGATGATVRSTPAVDGDSVIATDTAGRLLRWSATCASAQCAPTYAVTVDTPAAGAAPYRQTPALASGLAMVLGRRSVAGVDRVSLFVRDLSNGSAVQTRDLGADGLPSGIASTTVDTDVLYAPLAHSLQAIGPPEARPVASLTLSPLALSPAFAPGIFDYAVHCAAGANSLSLSMTAVPGGTVRVSAPSSTPPAASRSTTVSVTPNQAVVVEGVDAGGASARYWIRCLPPDFPAVDFAPHPGAGTATPGYYVLGNNLAPAGGGNYAIVLDAHGTPVWYRLGNPEATNVTPLAKNTIAFNPTLAFGGYATNSEGHYDVHSLATGSVTTIRAVGLGTDFHELQTTAAGDHLVESYPFKRGVDLTGLTGEPQAGPNSTIADCVVQDVDRNNNLVWEWKASDHFDPVTETTTAPTHAVVGTETVYDVFHCNSIDPKPDGNLIVSLRHMNAVAEIRRSDGRVLWKMGGSPVNKDGAAIIKIVGDADGGIVQQHDARYLPNGHISVFDNQTSKPARGVEFELDLNAHTAQPVFSFAQPDGYSSCCMGDFRLQPDGHRIIGWGYLPLSAGHVLTELDAAGHDVLDLRLGTGNGSYRVVKVPPTFFDLDVLRRTAGT